VVKEVVNCYLELHNNMSVLDIDKMIIMCYLELNKRDELIQALKEYIRRT